MVDLPSAINSQRYNMSVVLPPPAGPVKCYQFRSIRLHAVVCSDLHVWRTQSLGLLLK